MFKKDIQKFESHFSKTVKKNNFLVIGGAGSIGLACVKELFKRNPKTLHVIDINENNLTELVRDLRSSLGYIEGEFKTFTIDVNSIEFEILMSGDTRYDYVMNLSAMKHVRSEKDPLSLMRMIEINIINTKRIIELCINNKAKKLFCVSTDKASSPINMMGASKKIMELVLSSYSNKINISSARFANVLYSDGSLLKGIQNRFEKKQPIAAPEDIKRFFLTEKEAGELCLFSTLLGKNNQTFFPNPKKSMKAITFIKHIEKFLASKSFKIYKCHSEDEARNSIKKLIKIKKWPCFFFKSDTFGEKSLEQFYNQSDTIIRSKFDDIGIIKQNIRPNKRTLNRFFKKITNLKKDKKWEKQDLIKEFQKVLPDFKPDNISKSLEEKM